MSIAMAEMLSGNQTYILQQTVEQCQSTMFMIVVISVLLSSISSASLNALLALLIRQTKGISNDLKKLIMSCSVAAVVACCQQFLKSAWYLTIFNSDDYENNCLFSSAQCLAIDFPFLLGYGSFAYLTLSLIANRVYVICKLKHSKTGDISSWTNGSIILSIFIPFVTVAGTYILITTTVLNEQELHTRMLLFCDLSSAAKRRPETQMVGVIFILFATFVIVGSMVCYEKLLNWNQVKMNAFKKEGIQQNLDTRVALKETEKMASSFKWTSRISFGGWLITFVFAVLVRPILLADYAIYYYGALQQLFLLICLNLHPIFMIYFCAPLKNTLRRKFRIRFSNQTVPVNVHYQANHSKVGIKDAIDHVGQLETDWSKAWAHKQN